MDQPLTSSDHLAGEGGGGAEAGVRAEEEEGEGASTCFVPAAVGDTAAACSIEYSTQHLWHLPY